MPSPPPSLSQAERLDACCDRFEAAWRAGDSVRAEDWATKEPAADRLALLELLLPLEMELWQATGATLAAGEYHRRFPDNPTLVQRALDRFASRRASRDTSVSKGSARTGSFHPAAPLDSAPKAGNSGMPGRIGRFTVAGLLGAGAFGKVYRGVDPDLGREVAIKVPLAESVRTPNEKERFLREARAAATLQHPNVCAVHEVGEQDGMPFIVMALVPGQSLADLLKTRKQPLPTKQVALIVRKLALALDAAHRKGIIHRDLKPANIMFDRNRKDVVIMDFGLARAPTLGDATATQTGAIMGTPAYMSPEQARGEAKTLGPAADIYSLGVILYELLTGQRPFTGTVAEVLGKTLHVAPPRPSRLRPGVDSQLEAACLKALAKEPAERFSTMKEFAAAVDGSLRMTVAPRNAAAAVPAHNSGGDETEPSPSNLADLFAAMSLERKAVQEATAAAVEAAVARSRVPLWVWFALAGLIVAGFASLSLIYLTRPPLVAVTLTLDVDLTDKSLSFFLDGQALPAEQLQRPIDLPVGEHTLVVKRGTEVVREYRFNVTRDAGPKIELKDLVPPKPKRDPVVWQPLLHDDLNLKDPKVLQVMDKSSSATLHDGVLELRGHCDVTMPKLGPKNYIIRAQVRKLAGQRVLLRARLNPIGNFAGYGIWFTGWEDQAGSFGLGKSVGQQFVDFREVELNQHGDEWCEIALAVSGPSIIGYVNGQIIHQQQDDDSDQGAACIGVREKGHAQIRKLEVCVLDGTGLTPSDVYPPTNQPLPIRTEISPDRAFAEWAIRWGANVRVCTGEPPANLAELFKLPALTQIDLLPKGPFKLLAVGRNYGQLDAKGRALLARCRHLMVFAIWAGKITNSDLVLLKNCTNLRQLVLEHTPVDDEGLKHLKGLTRLEDLRLIHSRATGRGLADLGELPLSTLNLTPKDSNVAEALSRFTAMRVLNLNGETFNDADARQVLQAMSKLEELTLHCPQLTDAIWEFASQCKELRYVDLSTTRMTGDKFHNLAELPKLRNLLLNQTPLRNEALRHVRLCPQLKDLHCQATTISDISPLAGMTSLETLDLSNTQITDGGLSAVESLMNLHALSLNGTKITDDGLVPLTRLRNLWGLYLINTSITDAGVAHIAEIPGMIGFWGVDLQNTKVTDAAVDHLARIKNLNRATLKETKVTNAALWRLKAAKPKCNVEPYPKPDPIVPEADYQRLSGGEWQPFFKAASELPALLHQTGHLGQNVLLRENMLELKGTQRNAITLHAPRSGKNLAIRARFQHVPDHNFALALRAVSVQPGNNSQRQEQPRYRITSDGWGVIGMGRVGRQFQNTNQTAYAQLVPNEFYELLAVAEGTMLTVYVNGKRLLTVNDAPSEERVFMLNLPKHVVVKELQYRVLDK